MRIAKPLLLVTTPLGIAIGLYEAWYFAGGLVFLMVALLSIIGVGMLSVVRTIRRERAEELAREKGRQPPARGEGES